LSQQPSLPDNVIGITCMARDSCFACSIATMATRTAFLTRNPNAVVGRIHGDAGDPRLLRSAMC
jgi:hypothetical protein